MFSYRKVIHFNEKLRTNCLKYLELSHFNFATKPPYWKLEHSPRAVHYHSNLFEGRLALVRIEGGTSTENMVQMRLALLSIYPLNIFHLFGSPSWKSSDPKIIGIKTHLFENFSQERLPKILGGFFRVNIRLKLVIIPFCRCSKILGEAGKQEILQQMFRKF